MKVRLSTADEDARHAIFRKLSDRAQALDETLIKLNAMMASARQQLQTAVDAYNEALIPARDWAANVIDEIDREVAQDASADSAARASALAWREEYMNADFEPIDFDFPERLVLESEDHPHLLLDLSSRAPLEKTAAR